MEDLGGNSDITNGEVMLQPSFMVDNEFLDSTFDFTAGVVDFEALLDSESADRDDKNAYALSHIGQQMNADSGWRNGIPDDIDADPSHGERTSGTCPGFVGYNQFNVDAEMICFDGFGNLTERPVDHTLQPGFQSDFSEGILVTEQGLPNSLAEAAPGFSAPEALAFGTHIARNHLTDIRQSETRSDLAPGRLSKAQTRYLQGWLVEHLDDPYPKFEDISSIQLKTGLPPQRIKNWFARNRKKFITTGILPPNDRSIPLQQEQNNKVRCFSIDDNDDSPFALSNALANSSLTSLQQHSDGSSISVSSIKSTEVNQIDTYLHSQLISDLEISFGEWWLSTLAESFVVVDIDELASLPTIYQYTQEVTSDIRPYIVTDAVSHLLAGETEDDIKSSNSSISRWKAATEGARSGRLPNLFAQVTIPLIKPPTRRKRTHGSQSFSTAGNSNDAYSDRSVSSVQSKRRRLACEDVSYGSVTSGSHSVKSYSSHVSRRGRRLPPLANSRLDSAPSCLDEYDTPSFELYTAAIDGLDRRKSKAGTQGKRPIIYQCTCCRKEFERKSVWERHEAATHYHPTIWVCSPSPQWLKHQECAARPESERTYFRRDAFRQHLSGWHSVTAVQLQKLPIDLWERGQAPDSNALTCRFCGAKLKDWTDRIRHVANHFEHGYTMDSWAETAPKGVDKVKESVHFAMRKLRNHTLSFADALLEIPILPKIRKSDPLARAAINF